MTDKELLPTRYPDLFDGDEMVDPALERLITDLEIIYPLASYPSSLPEQLLSALETHLDQDDSTLVERPVIDFPTRPWSLGASRERRAGSWQRKLGALAAVMLTALLISALVLVLHQSRQQGQSAAGASSTTDLTMFWSFSMMNATTGWTQIENAQGNHSAILHTTDGGSQWQNVTPHQFPIPVSDDFYALNATTAWMVGLKEGPMNGSMLLRTTDSGRTWQSITLPAALSSSVIDHVHFLNTRFGWIEVQSRSAQLPNAFWLTSDGGKTWQRIAIPSAVTPSNVEGGVILALFDENTWALTNSILPTSNGKPIIYATHDAGSTWQQQVLAVPIGLSLSASTTNANVQIFSASDGLLELLDEKGHFFVYSTHNAGKNWQLTTPIPSNSGNSDLGQATFSDMNHGVTFAGPYNAFGKLLGPKHLSMIVTNDGGQHWKTISVPLPAGQQGQINSSVRASTNWTFVSPQVGWLAVDYIPSSPDLPQSGLYKTVDGGQTWTAVPYQIQNQG